MKYIVKKIMEPDYGCEERPDDYVAMDKVLLRDENGSEIDMEIADKELYSKDINEGDWLNHQEDIRSIRPAESRYHRRAASKSGNSHGQ